MKSQELKKISLAVLAAFALAACGSDGDGNNHTSSAATDTTAAQSDAAKKAAEQAAADKKAAEEAAKQAAADKKAAEDLMKKIEADKLAAEEAAKKAAEEAAAEAANNDHQQLTSKVKTKGESFVGFKHVVKNQSNFNTNNSSTTESKADVPEGMNVQMPDEAFANIVVGEGKKQGKDKTIYLEKFEFTPSTTKPGVAHLPTVDERTGQTVAGAPTGPVAPATSQDALVFQQGRNNYTNNYGKTLNGSADAATAAEIVTVVPSTGAVTVVGANPAAVAAGATAATAATADDTRNGLTELAEVYGNKTLVTGSGAAATNNTNLPLMNLDAAGKYQGDTLNHVQYGRVTSNLHGQDITKLKDGLNNGSGKGTLVGDYDKLGSVGSESHYFYRGSENTTAAQLADVKTKYAKFDYQGHAVSYGLDNNYNGGLGKGNNSRIPTALDATKDVVPYAAFVSGNHVKATVDLTNNTVNGSIYNDWYDGYKTTTTAAHATPGVVTYNGQVLPVTLVEFNGTLAPNGNIAGTSTYKATAADNASGVFGATLFGVGASEMGGMVASDNKEPGKAWGASLGAKRVGVTPLSTYTPPAAPAPLPSINNANNTTTPSNP